jgi:NADH-quinone oxidoreductase subunit C
VEAIEIFNRLERRFPGKVGDFKGDSIDPYLFVEPAGIIEVSRYLRDDPELKFEILSDLTAVDWPKEDRLHVVYHLYSYTHRHAIAVKVRVPREDPRVATVEEIWRAANWMEREVFDLFGVVFEGHGDLRRIMLPEDWVGHPLRKDYVEQEEYDGIRTDRSPLVEKLLR